MSRIGNNPISVPAGVEINVSGNNVVTVKGPKGELTQNLVGGISFGVKDGTGTVSRADETKESKSLHGLYRALIQNMIIGVSEGYKKELELIGVGYKADAKGQILELNLGYSHSIFMQIPTEVKVVSESAKGKPPRVTLESHDKQLVGQVAAKIRSLRKPEPFKGKGVKFVGEVIRKKAGKSAAK
jgi:large subunit ribosomal protein L6